MSNLYDADFFASQQYGSKTSANVIAPIIIDRFKPQSILDVGCGIGTWASVFLSNGIAKVCGIDGSYISPESLLVPRSMFLSVDLNAVDENVSFGTFDVALSLEVAEHLNTDRSQQFVGFLTNSAPVVVFGAAIPLQGGTGHINEQWPSFWCDQFAKFGYHLIDFIRPLIWNNPSVEYWYRQNTLVFSRSTHEGVSKGEASFVGPNLVHPELYLRKSKQLAEARDDLRRLKTSSLK